MGCAVRTVAWLLAALAALLPLSRAVAQVNVQVTGNQAQAQIALPPVNPSVTADITITFDTPINLSAAELNLTAQLVDPNDLALRARLPFCITACVTIEPAFPLLITVEPLAVPWLFASGFEPDEAAPGLLGFLNTYEFEIHTANLDCAASAADMPCPTTPYRLFKAPIGGDFVDYTDDVFKGSVRARGRDGAFSQFLIVADTRPTLTVELDKEVRLQTRIIAAALADVLRADLLDKLLAAQIAVLDLDLTAALVQLDALIGEVAANAGITIANRWSADHSLVNDAGEIEGLAQSLRFTLLRLQAGN